MLDFAKHFLGPVYVVVLVTGFLAVSLAAGPIFERSKVLGLASLLVGLTVSLYLAGAAKLIWERRIEDPLDQIDTAGQNDTEHP